MKSRKRFIVFITVIIACCVCSIQSVSAKTPYETYTYSDSGKCLISPNAYEPSERYSDFGEAGGLKSPSEIITDQKGNLYIADTGNNRIVVCDASFHLIKVIDKFNANGTPDSLNGPMGVFMTDNGELYVADTQNSRIVVFDKDLNFSRITGIIPKKLLPDKFIYKPKSIAVNRDGQIYIVSLSTNMGIMVLSNTNDFEGFIGAQRVSVNALQLIQRMFMSKEQLNRSTSFVPVEYSNLTIDSDGFIYVTSSSINRFDLFNSLHSTDSTYAPIKKINPSGTDVLRRNGLFSPIGDVNFDAYEKSKGVDPSSIEKVVLLNSGMYLLLDKTYSKMFAYDSKGNLLYAFGGAGEAIGLYRQLTSAAIYKDTLYALDGANGSVTVLEKTYYGKLLDDTVSLQEARKYDAAIKNWNEVLHYNNNFDLAYLDIGKNYLDNGQYKDAMDCFRLINNKEYYSKAYKYFRQDQLNKYGIWLLFGVVVLIVLLYLLFSKISARNNKLRDRRVTGKLSDSLLYGLFVVSHPFKGFYELKSESRGGVLSASIILLLAFASFIVNNLFGGYLASSGEAVSPVSIALNFLFPFALWCIANWCLTTLSDGKGTLKDIYIAVCYSLVPLILILLPATIVGQFLVQEEFPILLLFVGFGYLWMGFLVFIAMLKIHDYSLGKNVVITLLTFVGIGLILFLCMIFFSLIGQMATLIKNIISEISLRL